MVRKTHGAWSEFRDTMVELQAKARSCFLARWPAAQREDAEVEFYARCMSFQLNAKATMSTLNPSRDIDTYVDEFIAWHIVAGSNGIDEAYAPRMDFDGPFSHRALLIRIIDGTDLAFQPPAQNGPQKKKSSDIHGS